MSGETVENPFLEFAGRYRDDPVAFVRNVLGAEPDAWQAELLTAVARGQRKLSVKSGHGVGKSATLAWISVWGVCTHAPCKVVITAPSGPQLFDTLFTEVKIWLARTPEALQNCFDVKQDEIVHKGSPDIRVSARTSRAEQPEAMQGVHAEGGRVILIADEASGIPDAVFEAAVGSMSGRNCATLLCGNPTRASGYFFDSHTRLKHLWWTRTVSCLDSPRADPLFAKEIAETWGEDSNAYRIRVLGEFPKTDDDTLIPLDLITSAVHRDIVLDPGSYKYWGLDVSRFGSDASALCKRWGRVVPEKVRVWRQYDLMALVGAVKHEYDSTPPEHRPIEINVDVIGLGAGVVDRLAELKMPVRGINVGESPSLKDKYPNLRSELWCKGKEFLERRDCKLPDDDQLVFELSAPKYKFLSNGRLQVETKDEMKKRRVMSPNVADAFLLTLASDAIAAGGMGFRSTWNTPMKRNIRGVV